MYWTCGIFEACKTIIEKLIADHAGKVNYYYADSQVGGYEWIIAENDKISREFQYSMGETSINTGDPISTLETALIEEDDDSDEFIFGEDVWIEVVERTCDCKAVKFDKKTKFITGSYLFLK